MARASVTSIDIIRRGFIAQQIERHASKLARDRRRDKIKLLWWRDIKDRENHHRLFSDWITLFASMTNFHYRRTRAVPVTRGSCCASLSTSAGSIADLN